MDSIDLLQISGMVTEVSRLNALSLIHIWRYWRTHLFRSYLSPLL